MGSIYGCFTLPTSEENNSNSISVKDIILNKDLYQSSQYIDMEDIPSGSIIYKTEVRIMEAFNSISTNDLSIRGFKTDNDYIVMDEKYNDPTEVGTFINTCYGIIKGNETIRWEWNQGIQDSTSGLAILRIFYYPSEDRYESLLTAIDEEYNTMDRIPLRVLE